MPDPDTPPAPRRSRRLRRRFAALGIVGAVMVTLPVVQLLRWRQAELDALAAGRSGLNPVARAVHVQRGLLAHRDTAGQVLRGQPALEAERRSRQSQVDDRLTALTAALAAGPWPLALGESDSLRQDWALLTAGLLARSVDAAHSDDAHALLVEQTLQVIDLVADDLATQAAAEKAALRHVLFALLPLSLLAAVLAVGLWRDLARVQAVNLALQRRLEQAQAEARAATDAALPPPPLPHQAGGRAEAGALLERLRDGEARLSTSPPNTGAMPTASAEAADAPAVRDPDTPPLP